MIAAVLFEGNPYFAWKLKALESFFLRSLNLGKLKSLLPVKESDDPKYYFGMFCMILRFFISKLPLILHDCSSFFFELLELLIRFRYGL